METTRPEQTAMTPESELTMAQLQQMNIHGLQARANTLQGAMDIALSELSDEDRAILPQLEAGARKAELAHQRASRSAMTDDEKGDRDISAKNAAIALHALGEFIRGDDKRLKAFQTRMPLRSQLETCKGRMAHIQAVQKGKNPRQL